MYCDGLAIAVHVLTPSAGLPDYCASGGDVEKWSTTEEHIFNRADSNRLKKKTNKQTICLNIQRKSLHPDYGRSDRAEHC